MNAVNIADVLRDPASHTANPLALSGRIGRAEFNGNMWAVLADSHGSVPICVPFFVASRKRLRQIPDGTMVRVEGYLCPTNASPTNVWLVAQTFEVLS